MNNKEISFLIGLVFLVFFILTILNKGKNLAQSICNQVSEKEYNFIVAGKQKEIMNHGQLKLICSDIELDSSFVFYPDDIMPYMLYIIKLK